MHSRTCTNPGCRVITFTAKFDQGPVWIQCPSCRWVGDPTPPTPPR